MPITGNRHVLLVTHCFFLAQSLSPTPQFILKNYGENPDNYNEQLKKLETLRQVGNALLYCVLFNP
jgi:hypothetical protein